MNSFSWCFEDERRNFAANKKISSKSSHYEKIYIIYSHHADHPRSLGTEEQGAQTHQKEHHVCGEATICPVLKQKSAIKEVCSQGICSFCVH